VLEFAPGTVATRQGELRGELHVLQPGSRVLDAEHELGE
jgi:hypothetical protein